MVKLSIKVHKVKKWLVQNIHTYKILTISFLAAEILKYVVNKDKNTISISPNILPKLSCQWYLEARIEKWTINKMCYPIDKVFIYVLDQEDALTFIEIWQNATLCVREKMISSIYHHSA